ETDQRALLNVDAIVVIVNTNGPKWAFWIAMCGNSLSGSEDHHVYGDRVRPVVRQLHNLVARGHAPAVDRGNVVKPSPDVRLPRRRAEAEHRPVRDRLRADEDGWICVRSCADRQRNLDLADG